MEQESLPWHLQQISQHAVKIQQGEEDGKGILAKGNHFDKGLKHLTCSGDSRVINFGGLTVGKELEA